jgi:polyhydroxyalkanoate synthesis regulator phasin
MTELINKLMAEAGLSAEQAGKTLDVIKGFVKEKFPMLEGAVENVLGAQMDQVPAPDVEEKSWLDKISDAIPGDLGEKIEGFAKKAVEEGSEALHKAKDVAEDLYEKGKDKAEDLIEQGKGKVEDLKKKFD